MSFPVKRQENLDCNNDNEELEWSVSENNKEDQFLATGMKIDIDFEGYIPQDSDFHGIKILLRQLFLKANVDLSALTEMIISQNYVGSVLKQANDMEDDPEQDDDDDDDDDDNDDIYKVYGITTVINISAKQHIPCIQEFRVLLMELLKGHATDTIYNLIMNALQNDSQSIGFLINERFINIPAQISIPLFENLISEMKRATSKKMPYEFSYFLLICKLHKVDVKRIENKMRHNKKNMNKIQTIIWSNPEEEIFAENALASFEFSVENETDSGLSGKWMECDDEMKPFRRVLLIEANKLPFIINEIKNQVS